MSDLNFIPIPPRIEPVVSQPAAAPKSNETAAGPDFKDTLRKALGDITQQTDQVSQASIPRYEEMQQAMEAATHAFENTMQAHILMQNLIQDITPAVPKADVNKPKGE